MKKRLITTFITLIFASLMVTQTFAVAVTITLNAANILPGCTLVSLSLNLDPAGVPAPNPTSYYTAVGYDGAGNAIGMVSYNMTDALNLLGSATPAQLTGISATLPAGNVTVKMFENPGGQPANAAAAATGALIGSFSFNPAQIQSDCVGGSGGTTVWDPGDGRIATDAGSTLNAFYEEGNVSIYSEIVGSLSVEADCTEPGTITSTSGITLTCLMSGMFQAIEHETGADEKAEFIIFEVVDGEMTRWRRGHYYPNFATPADSWWEIYRQDGDWTGFPLRSSNAP